MSLPRRAPRQVRNDQACSDQACDVWDSLRAGRCGTKVEAGSPTLLPYSEAWDGRISLADSGGGITSVRPGRVRNRTKTAPEEKLKKPADETRKKSPPARKGPGRGRYVDEYARPAL